MIKVPFKLYYFEKLALVTYGINISFLAINQRPFFWGIGRIVSMSIRIFLYFHLFFLILSTLKWFILSLSQKSIPQGTYLKTIKKLYRPELTRCILGTIIAFQLTITGYSNVKQSMPILVTQTFDDIGQKIDESIRFGNLSIATLNTAKTHPFFTTFIDWSYFAFFVYIIFVLVILIMEFPPNNVRIQCFLGGLMILWGIGVYTYYLFPMIGPVYHVPEHYLTISNIPQHASNLQQKLLLFHTTLLNNPVSYLPVPFMGIAAMPSFHVAETFYFALALIWIKSWFVRLFGVLMFLITFFGSCYTGWHYFIDGIAGIIWATIVYIFTALCIKYKFSCSTKSPVIQLHLRTDQL